MGVTDKWKQNLKHDLPASMVVFLVALPLCLGIALASGAPLISGIIAGIVGGVVVGFLSGSNLSVSGPAAGLTTIVVSSLAELKPGQAGAWNPYEVFLVAVFISGALQLVLGYLKAGSVGNYVPSPVIKGMLAAIGIILILKQIPHALGYDADYEGDESYEQPDGGNTFTTIWAAIQTFKPAALIITAVTVLIMILWDLKPLKKLSFFQFVPGALIGVGVSIAINALVFPAMGNGFVLSGNHLANIPITGSFAGFADKLILPDFSGFGMLAVWKIAITIALVASLESLLSIEAVDKIDPEKHITSKNRELKAQGVGNMVSSLLGGLPITAVIVRSSANINAGGKTSLSAILHGFLLLFSVIFIAGWLNMIPLAALAGILFFVGFKLTSPSVIKSVTKKGYMQYIPFFVTILAILFTDLLIGILIGIGVGMVFTIRTNMQRAIIFTGHGQNYLIRFRRDVYFMNIKTAKDVLGQIPNNCNVLIDTSKTGFIDPDIVELVDDFASTAKKRGIGVEIEGQLEYIAKKYHCKPIKAIDGHKQYSSGKEKAEPLHAAAGEHESR